MDNVLIVSSGEQSISVLMDMLSHVSYKDIMTKTNCGEARRLLIDKDFDLCVINAPLSDESGISFARSIASNGHTQVILLVKSEYYDEITSKVEDLGIFTLSKPINKGLFWSALKLCTAAYSRVAKVEDENKKLLQKIDDIRIINRAKCELIEKLGMTEENAHKHIEKQAMDRRISRREVAESILATYEG